MKNATILFLVGASLSLLSCASPSDYNYEVVQPLGSWNPASDPSSACTVEVMRHTGFVGCALKIIVSVNGRDVATLGTGQKVVLQVPKGHVKFSVRWRGDSASAASLRLILTPDQTFRIGVAVQQSTSSFGRVQPVISEM